MLSIIGQTAAIPEKFKELRKLNIGDAPESFVYIRNALVHGNEEKRRKLQDISHLALYDVGQLAIWYIELCILFALKYRDPYYNRT